MATTSTLDSVSLQQENTRWTYAGVYRVTIDSSVVKEPYNVLVAAQGGTPNPVPDRYDAYAYDGGAFAQEFSVDKLRTDDHQANEEWVIRVVWKPLEPGTRSGDSAANPTSRPTKLRLEFEDYQEPLREAYNVDALTGRVAGTLDTIVNGALQPYHEQLVVDARRAVLVATKNVAAQSDVDTINSTFANTVNNGTFYGRAAHYAKFLSADVTDEIREAAYTYYQATIRVALGNSPWYWTIDNVGWQYWTGAACTGRKLNFLDAEGFVIPEPQKLALDGTALGATAAMLKIRYRPNAVDYSGLGIGTAW